MNRLYTNCIAFTLCFAILVIAGCGSQEQAKDDGHGHHHDHDHGAMPKSFAASVKSLKHEWAEISIAMNDGNPEGAHDPLHEVAEVLGSMADLAAETELSEDDWTVVKTEAEKLLDSFTTIDKTFHDESLDKLAAFESVKTAIDDSIAVLEEKLSLLGDEASEEDHGHNDHDHGDHDDHDHDEHGDDHDH